MAVGPAALGGWSAAAVRAAEVALELAGLDAARAHVRQLRAVLDLHSQHRLAGLELTTVPQVALQLRCSETRAGSLLTDALGLAELPEAFVALEWALLTVEQSTVVVTQLAPLTPPQRLVLWQRLFARLRADVDAGQVLSPARLKGLLAGWVIQLDPDQATDRREQAREGRKVDYRRRPDNLADVFLLGLAGPDAQAVLQRIQAASVPVGLFDERTADQRRLDAAVDLLLGRHPLPIRPGDNGDSCGAGNGPAAGCSCLPGTQAPCGAGLQVLVPLGAALGTTDETAELSGHGPLEPDLLQALLLNAPTLTAVFVDTHGVPVGLGRQTLRPAAGDAHAVRQALQQLAAERPDRIHPKHPDDHPPAAAPDGGGDRPPTPPPPTRPPPPAGRAAPSAAGTPGPAVPGPAAPTDRGHPAAAPGPYRVTGQLRRLLFTRSARCEWPACGIRSVRCDAEHDTAHPNGPSCACNLGPLCRRHHRIKQQGWTKTRGLRSAVTWTSPSGRSWTSPSQHTPPQPPVRALPPLPSHTPSPWDQLSPAQLEQELWWLADCPDDPASLELHAVDRDDTDTDTGDGPEHDRLHERLTTGDTRWTLDLADPYAWLDPEADACV